MFNDALSLFVKYKSLMKYEPEKPDEKTLVKSRKKLVEIKEEEDDDDFEEEDEDEKEEL